MKPKLPRFLLWTDKTSIDEFLREPINERLYYFYLDLKNVRWQIGPDESALKFFNEIYYHLTRVEYEHDLDLNFDKFIQEIEENIGVGHNILFVCKMFFAFILLRQNNGNVTNLFQSYIFYRYNRLWDEKTHNALGSIIKDDKKYSVDLKPTPCRVKDLKNDVHWDEVTNNFNRSSIMEVLDLWSSNRDKVAVLHLIENDYRRISRRPVKISGNVFDSMLRVDYNFFSNLYSELGGNEEFAKDDAEETRSTPTQVGEKPKSVEEDGEDDLPSVEEMAAACEKTQEESLWWGNASWSITYRIYCILGFKGNKESFIEEVKEWPFKKPFKYRCDRTALGRPLRNKGKIIGALKTWRASGASNRQIKLGERLMELLKHKKEENPS